jgi:hypothetical protein
MKIALWSLLLPILLLNTACSSKTQLHLYAKYLSDEQTSQVINKLDKATFDVVINQLDFPNSVNDNAIVYAPSSNSRKRLENLMVSLSALGFDVSNASLIAANNHSFTENNVGMFLLPDGVKIEHKPEGSNQYQFPMVNEYGAIDCQNTTTLYLKEPNAFYIEVDFWQEAQQQYLAESYQGNWQLTAHNQLILSAESWIEPLIFNKKIAVESKLEGAQERKWRVLSFTPDKTSGAEQQKSLQCTYTISLVL